MLTCQPVLAQRLLGAIGRGDGRSVVSINGFESNEALDFMFRNTPDPCITDVLAQEDLVTVAEALHGSPFLLGLVVELLSDLDLVGQFVEELRKGDFTATKSVLFAHWHKHIRGEDRLLAVVADGLCRLPIFGMSSQALSTALEMPASEVQPRIDYLIQRGFATTARGSVDCTVVPHDLLKDATCSQEPCIDVSRSRQLYAAYWETALEQGSGCLLGLADSWLVGFQLNFEELARAGANETTYRRFVKYSASLDDISRTTGFMLDANWLAGAISQLSIEECTTLCPIARLVAGIEPKSVALAEAMWRLAEENWKSDHADALAASDCVRAAAVHWAQEARPELMAFGERRLRLFIEQMYLYSSRGSSSLGFKFAREAGLELPIATAVARLIRLGSDMETVYFYTDTSSNSALLRQTDLFDLVVLATLFAHRRYAFAEYVERRLHRMTTNVEMVIFFDFVLDQCADRSVLRVLPYSEPVIGPTRRVPSVAINPNRILFVAMMGGNQQLWDFAMERLKNKTFTEG